MDERGAIPLFKEERGTEIGHSLEFDFVVPPPHSFNSLGDC